MIATTDTLHHMQIINITTFDEHNNKKVRRVKVRAIERAAGGKLAIIGVNMHLENPMAYLLSPHPAEKIERKPNTAYWRPFIDHGEGEE